MSRDQGAGVYLDHNATAPLRPEVRTALIAAMDQIGNPSSIHAVGRRARAMVDRAREAVATLVGAEPDRVIFTSGGTEANNLALRGGGRSRVAVSEIEHPCVLKARLDADLLAVDSNGLIDREDLAEFLADAGADGHVAVMLANNETGVLEPAAEIAALCREAGALFHCDAVQAAGKLDDITLAGTGADSVTLSGHKVGAPAGIGALVLADRFDPAPEILGGGQERGYRAGTENLLGIVGFGAAIEAILDHGLAERVRIEALRDRLEAGIVALSSDIIIHGREVARLPNTICAGTPGLSADRMVMKLDLAGVRVSAGSACSSGKVTPSHVLSAMGCDPTAATEAIRISLGWNTTEDDVDTTLQALERIFARRAG
ncbi:MAG: cysteine desulfurase family protein [Rhodospirillaceae bacterium]